MTMKNVEMTNFYWSLYVNAKFSYEQKLNLFDLSLENSFLIAERSRDFWLDMNDVSISSFNVKRPIH